jgi:hypothetical protein
MPFERVAEQRITAAVQAGAFSNLPNAGQKLDLESYFALPPHLRLACSLLKSANCAPQEIGLLNDVAHAEARLAAADNPTDRDRLTHELETARLRLNVALDRMRADARRGR